VIYTKQLSMDTRGTIIQTREGLNLEIAHIPVYGWL